MIVEELSQKNNNRLMIFELSVGGHYPEYISHLINYWCERKIAGRLDIVVSPQFFQMHFDVVQQVKNCNLDTIKIIFISSKEFTMLLPFNTSINRNLRAIQEWKLIKKYANKLNSDRVFLLYFDTRIIPIIMNKGLPCAYSGIYFRPSFHYKFFDKKELLWRDKLQQWREKIILSLVLKDSKLQKVFCLDPFAVTHINQINQDEKTVYLPDPVKFYENSASNFEHFKSSLKIDPSRQVHLLFGHLGRRKGLDKLLESITLLPAELCKKLCVLVVGSIDRTYYQKCSKYMNEINKNFPVEIIIKNQYIRETEIQNYFQLANVILAPYQRHVGMSGIINRAAAVRKPVLSSNYGLMGELTRRYKLGIAVDSTKAADIAVGLTKFLTKSPEQYCDFSLMKKFAEQNTPQKFASTIFEHILD